MAGQQHRFPRQERLRALLECNFPPPPSRAWAAFAATSATTSGHTASWTLAIEKLSGKLLHQAFQKRIFDPLSLEPTKIQDAVPLDDSPASYPVQEDRTSHACPQPQYWGWTLYRGWQACIGHTGSPSVPLKAYEATIVQYITLFKTDIRLGGSDMNSPTLTFTYGIRGRDLFEVRHYHHDIFTW